MLILPVQAAGKGDWASRSTLSNRSRGLRDRQVTFDEQGLASPSMPGCRSWGSLTRSAACFNNSTSR